MKNIVICSNRLGLVLMLCAIVVFGCRCSAPKPTPDPLVGWQSCHGRDPVHSNKTISVDYEDYIQKLPPEEKKYVREFNIQFFKNEIGQHAVEISIPLDGVWWKHVLFYDKDDKRIKAIKYAAGRYAS